MTEPTTIREHLEAIRDVNHPMEFGGVGRALSYDHAVAALALLDNADWDYELGGSGNHLLIYDVPDPAPPLKHFGRKTDPIYDRYTDDPKGD